MDNEPAYDLNTLSYIDKLIYRSSAITNLNLKKEAPNKRAYENSKLQKKRYVISAIVSQLTLHRIKIRALHIITRRSAPATFSFPFAFNILLARDFLSLAFRALRFKVPRSKIFPPRPVEGKVLRLPSRQLVSVPISANPRHLPRFFKAKPRFLFV